MWGLIPMIKRELVISLHREYKLNRADISRVLGITKGSVTQYIQGKRASDSVKLRRIMKVDYMIKKLSKKIAARKLTSKNLSDEFCLICKIAQKSMGIS